MNLVFAKPLTQRRTYRQNVLWPSTISVPWLALLRPFSAEQHRAENRESPANLLSAAKQSQYPDIINQPF